MTRERVRAAENRSLTRRVYASLTSGPLRGHIVAMVRAIQHGLSQLSSVASPPPRHRFPPTDRSAADALRGDWDKLGGDMRRAVDKVTAGGKK